MSNHSTPIVGHVLYVAEQHHPWRLADYERLPTRYHTPTTVAVDFGTINHTVKPQAGRKVASTQQYHVWCLPDDAAWERVQACRTQLQQAIDDLASLLRSLGSYASRLAEAGGIKQAPKVLAPTVISVDDPDDSDMHISYSLDPVPRIGREQITGHTPKMLHIERGGKPWSTSHQRNHFVCPSDADWERVQARHARAEQAALAWQALLRELGTYQAALADGRYARKQETPMATKTTTAAHTEVWHNLPPALAGWQWVGEQANAAYPPLARLRAPDGWMTKEYKYSNKAIAEALRRVHSQPKAQPPAVVDRAGALSSPLQECARRYVAARERAGAALLEMAEALAEARRLAKHGEWYTFLEATQTSEDQADRLLDIHDAAQNPNYADAVRRNFLSPTTAALLARPSTPAAVVDQVLASPTPPTKRQVEQQIQAAKPNPAPVRDLPSAPVDPLASDRRQLEIATTHLILAKQGSTAAGIRQHVADAHTALYQVAHPAFAGAKQSLLAEAAQVLALLDGRETPAPTRQELDPADTLILSKAGWDLIGTPRQKGMTTFYTFRYVGAGDEQEQEVAAGEVPFWAADERARAERSEPPAPIETPIAPATHPLDWNAIARESYRLGATSNPAEAWVAVGNIIRLLSVGDVPATITWLLTEASALVPGDLTDMADTLDDATYETLAAWRRDPIVPTLESEGIV